jgi:hypothetical protein
MLKVRYFQTLLFLVSSIPTLPGNLFLFAKSAEAFSYPEIQKSDVDTVSCYMQTSDGKILNLNSICGKKSTLTDNTNSISYPTSPYPRFFRRRAPTSSPSQ